MSGLSDRNANAERLAAEETCCKNRRPTEPRACTLLEAALRREVTSGPRERLKGKLVFQKPRGISTPRCHRGARASVSSNISAVRAFP